MPKQDPLQAPGSLGVQLNDRYDSYCVLDSFPLPDAEKDITLQKRLAPEAQYPQQVPTYPPIQRAGAPLSGFGQTTRAITMPWLDNAFSADGSVLKNRLEYACESMRGDI